MLEIDHITIAYGPTIAVHDVSLTVASGEFVVVTGSNGSGKSSLVRSVLGLVSTAVGAIRLDGAVATSPAQWRERRRVAAYVPQRTTPGTFPLLVHELLASSGAGDAALVAADRLGIDELVQRPLTTLSGGQLQRAYLARAVGAIAAGASLLLADEPTSALDFEGQDDVACLLAELRVDRLVVSHDTAVVRRADRVLEMAGGTVRERTA